MEIGLPTNVVSRVHVTVRQDGTFDGLPDSWKLILNAQRITNEEIKVRKGKVGGEGGGWVGEEKGG